MSDKSKKEHTKSDDTDYRGTDYGKSHHQPEDRGATASTTGTGQDETDEDLRKAGLDSADPDNKS